MRLIFEKDRQAMVDSIKAEAAYYSNVSNNHDAIKALIEFISMEKDIYNSLDASAKELIKPIIKDNISYFGIAFLYLSHRRSMLIL